jgi:hypothetical protein
MARFNGANFIFMEWLHPTTKRGEYSHLFNGLTSGKWLIAQRRVKQVRKKL